MLLTQFWKNRRGNVAPLFGLAIIPLIGAVGAAVDYSRANATRTAFQASLDSAALMLSKTAATTADDAALTVMATTYVNAMFSRPDTTNVAVQAHYTTDGGSKVAVTGSATINTSFMSIFGIDQLNISAATTSTWGNTRLRVALVLDNTGSMAQGGTSSNDYTSKMDALKTASHNLLTQLDNAAAGNADNVYVSIIPFSKDVNVGSSNSAASWLYWDDGVTTADNFWDSLNGSCNRSGSAFTTRSKCLAVNVCSKSSHTTQTDCVNHNGTWYPTAGTWTTAAHTTWNGCVVDRGQNFDTTNDAPGVGDTLYPTEQYGSCPASLVGLSNDWTALNDKITAMQPNGNTNQALGLQLGWQSLTAAPFTIPAKDPHYQYKQVIILLTDGLNTQDRWYSCPSNGPCPTIDGREQTTCDNIKNAGITIYAVQVNTGNDPTSTLLQNCASNTTGTLDHFFLLTSPEQIVSTFNQIGTAMTDLRLAM
ncbi:MAG TPA: pilus assembly protein TadG-related protein [Pseudolabrys sp.]|nr:pilus assembly protein TadG-related protein [Pseudolabrys sp.]